MGRLSASTSLATVEKIGPSSGERRVTILEPAFDGFSQQSRSLLRWWRFRAIHFEPYRVSHA